MSDEVSEPANMNVLILLMISSSDMRSSGGRSVAAFDFTRKAGAVSVCVCRAYINQLTKQTQQILS